MMNNTYACKVNRNSNNKTALVRLDQVVAPNLSLPHEIEVSMEPGDSDDDLIKKALAQKEQMDKKAQIEFAEAFEEATKQDKHNDR